jgi:putative protease
VDDIQGSDHPNLGKYVAELETLRGRWKTERHKRDNRLIDEAEKLSRRAMSATL